MARNHTKAAGLNLAHNRLSKAFAADTAPDTWDALITGIVLSMGSLDDYPASESAVASLAAMDRPFPLATWWAAAVYPHRLDHLILPPPKEINGHTVYGGMMVRLLADANATGMIEEDLAHRLTVLLAAEDTDARLTVMADAIAHQVFIAVTHMAGTMIEPQTKEIVDTVVYSNARIDGPGTGPEYDDAYLAVIANLTHALSFLAQAAADSVVFVADALGKLGDPVPAERAPYVQMSDVPVKIQEAVSHEIFLSMTKASTSLQLVESMNRA